MTPLKDFRCIKCNKLLGKVEGKAEIKCPRCGEMNNSSQRISIEEYYKRPEKTTNILK